MSAKKKKRSFWQLRGLTCKLTSNNNTKKKGWKKQRSHTRGTFIHRKYIPQHSPATPNKHTLPLNRYYSYYSRNGNATPDSTELKASLVGRFNYAHDSLMPQVDNVALA